MRWLLKFLGRARKFFQDLGSEPESKVQYFNVICASGHRVRGERTEGYQALRCPACGDGVFVLPRSPLPEPVAPARSSRPRPANMEQGWVEEGPVELSDPGDRRRRSSREPSLMAADAEIIWDDAPAETTDRRRLGTSSTSVQIETSTTTRGPSRFWEGDLSTTSRAVTSRQHRTAAASPSFSRLEPSGSTRRRDRPPIASGRPRNRQFPGRASRGELLENRRQRRSNRSASHEKPNRYTLIFCRRPCSSWRRSDCGTGSRNGEEYPLIAEKGRIEGIPALDAG